MEIRYSQLQINTLVNLAKEFENIAKILLEPKNLKNFIIEAQEADKVIAEKDSILAAKDEAKRLNNETQENLRKIEVFEIEFEQKLENQNFRENEIISKEKSLDAREADLQRKENIFNSKLEELNEKEALLSEKERVVLELQEKNKKDFENIEKLKQTLSEKIKLADGLIN